MTLSYKISDVTALSDDFITKFQVITDLKENEKLIIYDEKIYLDNNFKMLQPFTRWWNNYNRNQVVHFIKEEMSTYLSFLEFVREAYKDVKTSRHYSNELYNIYKKHLQFIGLFIKGINAMMVTYKDDEDIVDKLKKINEYLNYIPKIN